MSAEIFHFQLDMFETEQDRATRMLLEAIDRKHDSTQKSLDRVRKGTYANINEIKRDLGMIVDRLDIIERHICRGES